MSRSRPRSRAVAAALLALGLGLGLSGAAPAQQSTPIVVVDQERLFDASRYGQRVLAEIERRSTALAAENRGIEARLVAEERELTDLRGELEVDEFRARADDFDARVEALRAEQDAKGRAVARFRDEAQQNFFGRIGEVLTGILAERGAQVLFDRRAVLSVVESVDITDLAVARIDAAFASGELTLPPVDEAGTGDPEPGAEDGDATTEPEAPLSGPLGAPAPEGSAEPAAPE